MKQPIHTPGGRQAAYVARNRAALIRFAQEILAAIGPDATVEQFVAHAQVSPTTIYNYFTNKEALFNEALVHIYQDFMEYAHSDGPPDGSLEEMVDICRKLFRTGETHPEFSKILGKTLDSPAFVINALNSETLPALAHVASGGHLTKSEFEHRTRLFSYCLVGIMHGVHSTHELTPSEADASFAIALGIWNISPELAKTLISRPL